MTTLKLRRWDSAEYLKTEEDCVMYLQACIEEAGDDTAFIAAALGDIARAKNLNELAQKTGMERDNLYQALFGESNPDFVTVLKIADALGMQLHPQEALA